MCKMSFHDFKSALFKAPRGTCYLVYAGHCYELHIEIDEEPYLFVKGHRCTLSYSQLYSCKYVESNLFTGYDFRFVDAPVVKVVFDAVL